MSDDNSLVICLIIIISWIILFVALYLNKKKNEVV